MIYPDYTLPLDQLPDPLPIVPLSKPFDVTIRPPGSKSITNRAYVLAAFAKGESQIIRPLRSDDTDALLHALCALGAEARWSDEGEDVYITGVNGRFPRGGHVNLGDGGTPTRFMIACACLAAEPVVVDGSKRMRERPIAEGVEMLRELGAQIEYVEEEGRLPVRVTPSENLKGGTLTVGKTASSQFISAIMLIAPWLQNGIDVEFTNCATSPTYIHLTLGVLTDWDVHFRSDVGLEMRGRTSVRPGPVPSTCYRIEPDASSAGYWVVAAALAKSKVFIPGIPFLSQQPDVYVAKRMNPSIMEFTPEQWRVDLHWPIDDKAVEVIDCDARNFPDGSMALSIAAACGRSTSVITGLHTLRVKETDRIAALANELTKVGCVVETTDDSITITPIPREKLSLPGDPRAEPGTMEDEVTIETYHDHRMAMAFAILGLVRPGISIRNPACVAKSYPGFWRDFAKLYQ